MDISIWFWVIYILSLLFGVPANWPADSNRSGWFKFGGSMVVFLLIGLIGWKVFGPPVKD